MSALRVFVLSPDAYTGYGGIAQASRDLIDSVLASPEVSEVHGLSRAREENKQALPGRLRWRSPAGRGKASLMRALLRALREVPRCEVVLVTHINLLPLAMLARVRWGARLAVVLHGVEAWWPRRRWLLRPLLAKVDRFLAVSDFTRQRFLAWTGLRGDKVAVHPNCVDLTRFSPGTVDHGLLRRHDLEGKRVLLLVARLSPEDAPNKGIEPTMEALPTLLEGDEDLVLAVAGKGEDRARLEARAGKLGVSDQVRFLGFVPDAEMPALYRSAAAYVMPGRGEGFGLVYLEAMACGTPVLGSTRDASQEVIDAVGLGVVVDPEDRESLLSGLRQVLSMESGKRPARIEAFSRQAYAARTAELLDELAEERRR